MSISFLPKGLSTYEVEVDHFGRFPKKGYSCTHIEIRGLSAAASRAASTLAGSPASQHAASGSAAAVKVN